MPVTVPAADPSAEDIALFAGGSRTVKMATAEYGLSRTKLFELMASGELRWARLDDARGTRLIALTDLVRHIAARRVR